MPRERSDQYFDRASQVLPLGVTSNFRYWGDDKTLYAQRGEGAHVWDVDGNRYVDYRMGFGPVILGHAYPPVVEAVRRAIGDGTAFALTTDYDVRVAEKVCRMGGLDMLRFAASGTEATMHAIRVARAFTGRDKIIKFEGGYHGAHDYVLFSTYPDPSSLGARRAPIAVPASSGIPRAVHELCLTLPFNDREVLDLALARSAHEVAAIILEPGLGNTASIDPADGWLQFIRQRCDEHGIVMILDEVKTGFRVAPGGAQEVYGVKADLVTYAKSLGNGFPIACFGGKREIMSAIGHGLVHAGTYAGNIVSLAAADAVTDLMADGEIHQTLAARGHRLMQGLGEILNQHGVPHQFYGYPALFGLLLSDERITDYRGWSRANPVLTDRFYAGLIERGVMPDPDCREPWYLSYSHDDAVIDATLAVAEDTVKALF
jgi:glutamate-1-semialdehyde 2,1-aminomutase